MFKRKKKQLVYKIFTALLFFCFFNIIYAQNGTANDQFVLRINSGGEQLTLGQDTFESDNYFVGDGKIFKNTVISAINGTDRDALYLSERSADINLGSFSYAIPLENGTYSVNLHFAEIWWGANGGAPGGTGKRVFDVAIEENKIVTNYDINAEVGTTTAVVKTFEVIVLDGILNIDFSASANRPKLSAVEVIGTFKEQEPFSTAEITRINCGGDELIVNEHLYMADDFFSGDERTFTNSNIANISSTTADALYLSERTTSSDQGEFYYNIPLNNGSYQVKLHFAEIWWGAPGGGPGGLNKRVFNVEIEGEEVLSNFDIVEEAGSMAAIIKTYNTNVNDGTLNLSFSSSINRPKLSAIEILTIEEEVREETELPLLTRINSGGSEIVINGQSFESDTYHRGDGKSYSNNNINNILETALDDIYKSERSTNSNKGTFEYAIPVTDGDYRVNLHFAEIFFGATNGGPNGIGKRVFDVSLEGKPVLTDFDINKEVGTMTAIVKSYETSVVDGELNLVFSAAINQPKLSAIELFGNGEIIEVFKPCVWRNLADAKEDHIEGQSATINGKLYTMSGFNEKFQAVEATEIYDPTTNTWSFGEPMPLPVTHGGMAAVNDEVWIIGGFAGNHPGVATDRVQIYNTLTDTWIEGPKLPERRGSGAAAFNQGKVHFFGGLLPDRDTDVGEHYFYDLFNETAGWQSAAPLPNPRNHLGGTSNNGLVYAVGGQFGHDKGGTNQKFVHAYDPQTDSWARLQDIPTNRSHFEVGTISHNEKVIIAGGNKGADDILEFDPLSNEWTELCKLPEALLTPTVMVWENRLIVTGGGAPNNRNPTNKTRWVSIAPSNIIAKISANISKNEEIILVYPNPLKEELKIGFKNQMTSGTAILYDLGGQILNTYRFNNVDEYTIQFNHPKGMYLIKVLLDDGTQRYFKIIKD